MEALDFRIQVGDRVDGGHRLTVTGPDDSSAPSRAASSVVADRRHPAVPDPSAGSTHA